MTDMSSWFRCGVRLTAVVALSLAFAPSASAQHRARLSADLDDAIRNGSPAVDVIVNGDKASIDATAAAHGLRVKRYLKSGAVFQLTAGQLSELRQDPVYDHLSSDIRITPSDVTTDTIEADRVWAGAGAIARSIGAGVGVAVIDSGVDFNHAALKGRIAASVDFTGGNGVDRYGHGTHVAATIAGAQGSTADTRAYRGVASGAQIISLRVLGDDGSGMASSVIEAIDWAIDHRAQFNIRVINLSLGAPVLQPYRDDPLCEAAERAVSAGIVVVAAAGNFGKAADGRTIIGGITAPANDPSVLTVGALDAHATSDRGDDTVAAYSSRGPSMYDLVMKPDLVAPGSHVVAAEAPGSYFSTAHPERHVAGAGEGSYMQLSGTSMAAAVASGAVALLLDEEPRLSPNDVKVVMQMTSTLMPSEGLLASGAGSMNAYGAVEFADGFVNDAIAMSLGGEATAQPRGRSDATVYAQLVSNASTGSSNGPKTVITFGTAPVRGRTFVWGKAVVNGQAVAWGSALKRRIVAAPGMSNFVEKDSMIWSTSADEDSIVWGNAADEDSIVWGNSADEDSIVWGNSADEDSIVWGNSADEDSIVWGNSADEDSIVWGNSADEDSIVWGNAADEDSIVWGN